MINIAKIGHYFEKRHEVSFWVNILMFATFVMSNQYVFAGMTLALAVVQFHPMMVVQKIPAAWQEKILKRVLHLTYCLGPKSFLVSTNGVMKVVRYKKRGDNTLFVCRCSGEFRAAIAESNRFCKTTQGAVHLLASMYHEELKELRQKVVHQPEKE
ncbi:hypothetical protein M5X11_12790 [Paenibacillus alginolyticus]|uniref:hypothetical protein n=1 Tax=Paenibacillus alginolyticus TaxID=59839 RepID=UPI0004288B35|nr:hypothetical protein [Paenibacillus alginolyticus]MCY9665831.1 hypothetical protein [Paenibacillus alginolyticus]